MLFIPPSAWCLENGLSGTATVDWKGASRKRFIGSCKRHHGNGFQKSVSPRTQQRFGGECARTRFLFHGEPRARKVGLLGREDIFLFMRTFYNRDARACPAEPLPPKRLRDRTFLCARARWELILKECTRKKSSATKVRSQELLGRARLRGRTFPACARHECSSTGKVLHHVREF